MITWLLGSNHICIALYTHGWWAVHTDSDEPGPLIFRVQHGTLISITWPTWALGSNELCIDYIKIVFHGNIRHLFIKENKLWYLTLPIAHSVTRLYMQVDSANHCSQGYQSVQATVFGAVRATWRKVLLTPTNTLQWLPKMRAVQATWRNFPFPSLSFRLFFILYLNNRAEQPLYFPFVLNLAHKLQQSSRSFACNLVCNLN